MMSVGRMMLATAFSLFAAGSLYAQQPQDLNLKNCLTGKTPGLCNHSRLTPDQMREVRAAELQENLRVCSTGKYPDMCDRSKLTLVQKDQAERAEQAENLKVCLSGKYPALCSHDLLSDAELKAARSAEKAENFRVCMDGRHPERCNHGMLAVEQKKNVAAAEAKADSVRGGKTVDACDSDHWIATVSLGGKLIKLEDNSLWEVNDVDIGKTAIWLPVSEVVICGNNMINVEVYKSAEVKLLMPGFGGGEAAVQSLHGGYVIESSVNDKTFTVNGKVFKAREYCFGFEKGDVVRFLSGSPFGKCTSATMQNLGSGHTCDVWCEQIRTGRKD